MKKTFTSLTCFLLLVLKAHSQDGTLDLSFGNNGFAISEGYFNTHNKRMQAIQPDGKIVTGGENYDGGIVIYRFNSNGSLDNGFSDDGKFTITGTGPLWTGILSDIEIQSDGKIVVLFSQGSKKLILRLTSAGILDIGFGNSGITETNFAFNSEYTIITVQESGKIIILENVYDESGFFSHGVIQRLNGDGTIDVTFGINGEIILENTIGLYLGVQRGVDNSIIYCEMICEQNDCRLLFKQINEDGTSHILFNIIKPIAGDFKVQPNGKLYIGGAYYNSILNRSNPAVFCYNSTGELDNGFDNDGIIIIPVDGIGSGFINRIEIQGDGHFLLSGHLYFYDGLNYDRFLIKLKPDGSLDHNFNESGIFVQEAIHDQSTGVDYFSVSSGELFLQTDGKILLCGTHNDESGESGLYAFRLHNSVISSCAQSNLTVIIPDTYAVNPGANPNTVYIGYQPASSITLNAQASGGNASYSYSWSTNPVQTTQQITVSPAVVGTYNYTVTATDASGCSAQATKTITAVDIRTPGKPGKVNICHRDLKGKWTTLSVLAGSVPEHLAHGDYLGTCLPPPPGVEVGGAAMQTDANEITLKEFKIYPNPATHFIDVQWTTKNTSQSTINILNVEGKLMRTFTMNGTVNTKRISLGGLAKGIYMLVLKTGSDQQVSKFVIQ
jgi:uncharacterized delta-60 repeat protein